MIHKEIGERQFSQYQMRSIRQMDQSNEDLLFNNTPNVINEVSSEEESLQD